MTSSIDYNALLLKVMAHDLLAPLTAVKWQTELLEKSIQDKKKRSQYMKGIADSTELGIALTRHVHVAARVLGGGYQGALDEGNLSVIIKESISALTLQFQRHGLVLETDIDTVSKDGEYDEALLSLFVWSVGKFFLTCTPPETTVKARGMGTDDGRYIFSVSAPNIKEREILESLFSDSEYNADFDQTFVFVKLLKETAPALKVELSVEQDAEFFAVTAVFG